MEENDLIYCYECGYEIAEYKYDEDLICPECLMNKLEEENKIETWTVKHYMIDGEYYGNDNDNDFSEIAEYIAKRFRVKKIK